VPNARSKGPLFEIPAWKDWTMWLGLALGGMSTYSSLVGYFDEETPSLTYLTSYGIISMLIDGCVQFAIAFAMFGVVPASIRRFQRSKQLELSVSTTDSAGRNTSLLLLPLTAIAVSVLAADFNARATFTDTSRADEVKAARESVEGLSSEQVAAFTSLKELPSKWNDLSLKWVTLYSDPNIGFANFGAQAQPIVNELRLLVDNAVASQDSLVGSEAELIFGRAVTHYSARLEAVQGITSAIAVGDAATEQKYGELLADLNARNTEVACALIRNTLASPFAGGLGDEEYQRGLDQLSQC